jgi:hypothetical protein
MWFKAKNRDSHGLCYQEAKKGAFSMKFASGAFLGGLKGE